MFLIDMLKVFHTVAYLRHARTVELQKQPLLNNTRTQQYNSGVMQSLSRQRLDKHVPANTQQWGLCSLWAMLQLVARLHNNSDNRGWGFLCGPCRGYITRFPE
jgi:hypothetical protein